MLALKILWLFLITFYLGRADEINNQHTIHQEQVIQNDTLNKVNAPTEKNQENVTLEFYANRSTKQQRGTDSISEKFDADQQILQEELILDRNYLYDANKNAVPVESPRQNLSSTKNNEKQLIKSVNFTYIQEDLKHNEAKEPISKLGKDNEQILTQIKNVTVNDNAVNAENGSTLGKLSSTYKYEETTENITQLDSFTSTDDNDSDEFEDLSKSQLSDESEEDLKNTALTTEISTISPPNIEEKQTPLNSLKFSTDSDSYDFENASESRSTDEDDLETGSTSIFQTTAPKILHSTVINQVKSTTLASLTHPFAFTTIQNRRTEPSLVNDSKDKVQEEFLSQYEDLTDDPYHLHFPDDSPLKEENDTIPLLFEDISSESDFDWLESSSSEETLDTFLETFNVTDHDFDKTVDDIFKESNYDFEFPESKTIKSNLGDVIEKWLNEAKNKEKNTNSNKTITTTLPPFLSRITLMEENVSNPLKRTETLNKRNFQDKHGLIYLDSTESQLLEPIENTTEESDADLIKIMQMHNSKKQADETTTIVNQKAKVITESRMAFQNEPSQDNCDKEFLYGTIWNRIGDMCVSLNLSMELFVNDTKLQLSSCNEIETYCEKDMAFIKFSWFNTEEYKNLSIGFRVLNENNYCSIDQIRVRMLKYENHLDEGTSSEIIEESRNLQLFKTKMGSVYENNASIVVNMDHGLKMDVKSVIFFVNEIWYCSELNVITSHYKEIIGALIGCLVFSLLVLIAFKKFKNETAGFKPTIA